MKNWAITKDKFIRPEHVTALYNAINSTKNLGYTVLRKDYYIIRILLETGLRVSELTKLVVTDFFETSIQVNRTKGDKSRTVLLTKDTAQLFRDLIEDKKTLFKESVDFGQPLLVSRKKRPYSTRSIRRRVKYWFSKVGLPDHLSCHSCRHTYISFMIKAGIDLVTIRDNVGHASIATTNIYIHATREGLGDLKIY